MLSTNTLPQELPAASIDELIAIEFPRVVGDARTRLLEFTRATQAIAHERGGEVTDRALVGAGFSLGEQARLMPQAERLMSLLDQTAAHSPAA